MKLFKDLHTLLNMARTISAIRVRQIDTLATALRILETLEHIQDMLGEMKKK